MLKEAWPENGFPPEFSLCKLVILHLIGVLLLHKGEKLSNHSSEKSSIGENDTSTRTSCVGELGH